LLHPTKNLKLPKNVLTFIKYGQHNIPGNIYAVTSNSTAQGHGVAKKFGWISQC
jgi:hypothetical protein